VIGGVETVLETTCEALASSGHAVTMLTSSLPGTLSSEVKDGYSIIRSDHLAAPDNGLISSNKFDYIACREFFETVVKESRPDVIHFHNYQMKQYSMFLNSFLHAIDSSSDRVIFNTIHNDSSDAFSAYILSYYPIDRVITTTRMAAMDLIEAGVPTDRMQTIPNMIDVSRFEKVNGNAVRKRLGVEEGDQVILFPSRLIGREGNFIFDSFSGKGLDVILRAMPEIIDAVPNAKLMLLGNDPVFADKLSKLKLKLSRMLDSIKSNSLLFLNYSIPNSLVPSLIAASNLVVSLSPREAFGMVFLEAMACSKPVVGVSSAASGVSEVVPDEIAGYLVPEKDPHATAKAIIKILSDDNLKLKFQIGGNNWVKKRFDTRVVLPKLLQSYGSALKEKHEKLQLQPYQYANRVSDEMPLGSRTSFLGPITKGSELQAPLDKKI
jgi:glycosyltransferase involved in cell wall biosynthesis